MYGTIVVGFDATHEADQAAAAARDLAKQLGDPVVVVHVQPLLNPAPGTGPQVTEEADEANEVLASAMAVFSRAGIQVSGQVHRAPNNRIGQVLVDVAKSLDAGLLVVGTRGHGDIHSAIFGSTAHQVIHLADIPVMVVRDTLHHD